MARPFATAPGAAARLRALTARLDRGALRDAWRALWWSRLVVVALGIYEWIRLPLGAQFVRGAHPPEGIRLAHAFDGWPAQGIWRALFEPYAVWDSVGFTTIAHGGYGAHVGRLAVFFPLYPGVVRVASLFIDSTAAVLVAAYAVSLVALLGAFYLLHRLTELELGRAAAWPVLLVTAFYPAAFVLGIPYTESLFLLLSIGAVYAARTGHWAWAGILGGLAAATRNTGVFLLLPLGVFYLWGPRSDGVPLAAHAAAAGRLARLRPRFALRPDAAWLLLVPAGIGAYMAYLAHKAGDPLAWAHAQTAFHRINTSPVTGLSDSIKAAWNSLRGHNPEPFSDFGSLNVLNLVFYAGAVAALVGVFRRLPLAYGLYCIPPLFFPLVDPWPDQPIASMIRYILSLFPILMWLGAVSQERGRTELVVGVFAMLGGVLAVQFASGLFAV